MKTNQTLVISLSLIILVVISLILKNTILGGLPLRTLQAAPPLSGVVSQSLANFGTEDSLPVAGKDYKFQGVHYFDSQSYAVVSVAPIKNTTDSGILVLQRFNGFYQVILGPGTAFSASDVHNLPADVVQYLKGRVLIYAAVN